jgi:hypothetical protein
MGRGSQCMQGTGQRCRSLQCAFRPPLAVRTRAPCDIGVDSRPKQPAACLPSGVARRTAPLPSSTQETGPLHVWHRCRRCLAALCVRHACMCPCWSAVRAVSGLGPCTREQLRGASGPSTEEADTLPRSLRRVRPAACNGAWTLHSPPKWQAGSRRPASMGVPVVLQRAGPSLPVQRQWTCCRQAPLLGELREVTAASPQCRAVSCRAEACVARAATKRGAGGVGSVCLADLTMRVSISRQPHQTVGFLQGTGLASRHLGQRRTLTALSVDGLSDCFQVGVGLFLAVCLLFKK